MVGTSKRRPLVRWRQRPWTRVTSPLAVAGATCFVALAHGQRAPVPPQRSTFALTPAFAGRDLTASPTTGWPTSGGDWFNRRYSPLTQINRDNVASLKAVWRTRLNGS